MLLNCGVGEASWGPLDCKEIQSVDPKGDPSWVFIGTTHAEAETNNLATWCEELIQWKRPWCWERLRAGGEGDGRGWDGWMASPTQWTWVWVNFGSWWWTGRPGMLQSMGLHSRRRLSDRTELNWGLDIISSEKDLQFSSVQFSRSSCISLHGPVDFCSSIRSQGRCHFSS